MKFSGVLIKGLDRELQCAATMRSRNVDSNETLSVIGLRVLNSKKKRLRILLSVATTLHKFSEAIYNLEN